MYSTILTKYNDCSLLYSVDLSIDIGNNNLNEGVRLFNLKLSQMNEQESTKSHLKGKSRNQ